MANFTIELSKKISFTHSGDNFNDAIAAAKEFYPDFTIDFVINNDTEESSDVFFCECGKPILDSDKYAMDEDGLYYCSECMKG